MTHHIIEEWQTLRESVIIGHINEYPTMHYFGNPRHTDSMIAYRILTEQLWKFQ